MASDAFETSSRRKISRFEYREWVIRWRSCFSSVLNSSFSADMCGFSRTSRSGDFSVGGCRLASEPPARTPNGIRPIVQYGMRTLADLPFDNTYARLPEAFYQRVEPTPVPNPYLVAFNPAAALLIDLDPAEAANPDFVQYFAGNKKLPGSEPVAMKYAGHQFGTYVPQLGDGRAILLGEVRNVAGERWDLHLKGAGKTAFSRFGDGRAVLRSSIREYLCCEAMHALGIPTTRALCVVGTDLEVYRECVEPGALIVRTAPSHVRFGSFEV